MRKQNTINMLTDFDEESGDEGEAMTAAEVLQKLEEAWLNEKFSPELLENRSDIVDCMLEQIHEMEENIRRAKKGDFKVSIHKMEIDRIRYVLSSYLRCRIQKIEKCAAHILEEEKENPDQPRLTPEELQYAQEYKENLESHFTSLALRHMPPNLRNLDAKQTTMRPVMNSYVFLRVNDNVEGVMVEEETTDNREEIVDLEKGDQHIMRYQPIKGLVSNGNVQLI